jgi:hypothetical protein
MGIPDEIEEIYSFSCGARSIGRITRASII